MFLYQSSKDALIAELEEVISDKIDEVDNLKTEIANLKSELNSELQRSDVEVDFDAMNAFSVERVFLNGIPVTSVGYFDKEEKVREWYLYTSVETHQRVVDDFREFKFNKYNSDGCNDD